MGIIGSHVMWTLPLNGGDIKARTREIRDKIYELLLKRRCI